MKAPTTLLLALALAGLSTSLPAQANAKRVRSRTQASARPKVVMPPARQLVSTSQSGGSRSAAPLRTLPDLQVTGRDDKPLSLQTAAPKGHWVLLYRAPVCAACDRLMTALSGNGNPDTASVAHLTVLVGTPSTAAATSGRKAPAIAHGSRPAAQVRSTSLNASERHSQLETVHTNFAALDHATWAYDTDGAAYTALKPAGSPTMYGMDGNRIAWRAAGIPGSPADLQHRIAQWVLSSPAVQTASTAQAAAASPVTAQ